MLEDGTCWFDADVHSIMSFVSLPGHEGALCAAFANCMYPLEGENLRYVYFNFHKECAKLRFDRLSILMEKLATDLAGPFVYGATNERAVARSSCLQPVVLWCCVQHTAVWFGWFGLVGLVWSFAQKVDVSCLNSSFMPTRPSLHLMVF